MLRQPSLSAFSLFPVLAQCISVCLSWILPFILAAAAPGEHTGQPVNAELWAWYIIALKSWIEKGEGVSPFNLLPDFSFFLGDTHMGQGTLQTSLLYS